MCTVYSINILNLIIYTFIQVDHCNDVNVVTIKKTYDFAGEDVV